MLRSLACLGRLGGDRRLPGRRGIVRPGTSSDHRDSRQRRLRAALSFVAAASAGQSLHDESSGTDGRTGRLAVILALPCLRVLHVWKGVNGGVADCRSVDAAVFADGRLVGTEPGVCETIREQACPEASRSGKVLMYC